MDFELDDSMVQSVVQILASVRCLTEQTGVVQADEARGSIRSGLIYCMRQLYHPKCPAPIQILGIIRDRLGGRLLTIEQFLETLLQRVTSEESGCGTTKGIFSNFVRGVHGSVIRCKHCGLIRESRSLLYVLDLSRVRRNNLECTLHKFLSSTNVYGVNCGTPLCTSRRKKSDMWSTVQVMPRLAPIFLGSSQNHDRNHTTFPLEIDMVPFVRSFCDLNLNVPRIRYKIRGVIEQAVSANGSGRTAIAYVRVEDGSTTNWYRCNRSFTTKTTWETVREKRAVLLFYECMNWDLACALYECYLRLYEKRDFS